MGVDNSHMMIFSHEPENGEEQGMFSIEEIINGDLWNKKNENSEFGNNIQKKKENLLAGINNVTIVSALSDLPLVSSIDTVVNLNGPWEDIEKEVVRVYKEKQIVNDAPVNDAPMNDAPMNDVPGRRGAKKWALPPDIPEEHVTKTGLWYTSEILRSFYCTHPCPLDATLI